MGSNAPALVVGAAGGTASSDEGVFGALLAGAGAGAVGAGAAGAGAGEAGAGDVGSGLAGVVLGVGPYWGGSVLILRQLLEFGQLLKRSSTASHDSCKRRLSEGKTAGTMLSQRQVMPPPKYNTRGPSNAPPTDDMAALKLKSK